LKKKFNEEKIKHIKETGERPETFYLNFTDIDKNEIMPHSSTYLNHFRTLEKIYELLGIDLKTFSSEIQKEDMIKKYSEIYNIINKVPTSRDLDEFSLKNNKRYYSCSTYLDFFDSLYDIQETTGENIIKRTPLVREEMIDDLIIFCIIHKTYPTQRDIDTNSLFNYSSGSYCRLFGSIEDAMNETGFPIYKLKQTSQRLSVNGKKCGSFFEQIFCNMLENNNIFFEKESYYKDFIKDFNKKR